LKRTMKGRLAMNPKPEHALVPEVDCTNLSSQSSESAQSASNETMANDGYAAAPVFASGLKLTHRARGLRHFPSPLRWKSAYVAFFATVFACVAAAATVASNDMPLLLGGF
ncbi:MAG: hypothetical protein ABIR56_09085, partial [Polaromonas sp.]